MVILKDPLMILLLWKQSHLHKHPVLIAWIVAVCVYAAEKKTVRGGTVQLRCRQLSWEGYTLRVIPEGVN